MKDTIGSVYGSTHALIGRYSEEINPKDCGITRLTNGWDDMCYKWHKISLPAMKSGRKATPNEVPWMAIIFRKEYDSNGQREIGSL